MSQPPRDWDKELAKIDRAMAETPARPGVPAPSARAAPGPTVRGPSTPAVAGRARAATWFRVLLTVALAVALPLWPYAHGCGSGLWLYLAAVAVTGLSAVWAAFSAWHRRQGLAHLLALLSLAWVVTLGAREVLPRTGYARATSAWVCG